ncbi:MAG: hypothetical protein M1824_000298 [Vezdaea acicularis]|nr:MAG: hypothetical protein M1824_000298 [Vezdaea acicularis]
MAESTDLGESQTGLLARHRRNEEQGDLGYQSSDDDLDEHDPLNHPSAQQHLRLDRPRNSSHSRKQKSSGVQLEPAVRAMKRGLWHRRKCLLISLGLLGVLVILLGGGGTFLYKTAPKDGLSPPFYPSPRGGTIPSWEESYRKAEEMVKKMSLVEKVNVTTGVGWMMDLCVGNTGPAENAGFPALCLQDGPLGIRFADLITAFPAGITTGATWNKDLIYKRGRALGAEFRLKGVNVMLGPAMGPLGRMPAGGRNWEGFGSDPVLQGIAAAETIRGIQDEGVIATAKHYVANEQEHYRQDWAWGTPHAISSNIDDRTLHEVYTWPFADSIRAGVASVMCSYQMVNNSYACGNSKILNGVLKDELGFQGFVQSDWLAQRSGVASALSGLDMSMPGDGLGWADGKALWGASLTTAVLNGSVPMWRMNDMVTRIVAAWYQLGQDEEGKFTGPNFSSWTRNETSLLHPGSDDKTEGWVNHYKDVRGQGEDSHSLIAKQVATEGIVLVKNEGNILPLNREGWVDGHDDEKQRIGIFGEDAGEGRGRNACADRGCNQGTLASGWGSGAVDFEYLVTPEDALRRAFNSDKVQFSSYPTNVLPSNNASSMFVDQDICLVFINSDGGEGYIASDNIRGDRNDLYPQKGGDKLVQKVAANCGGGKGETIVIIHSIGPVVVERWHNMTGVKAIVMANLPGEDSGNSLVDVLLGNENPSGKLPYTVGKSLAEYGKGGQILYYPNAVVPQQDFKEGLYIDYRHFDKNNIEPRYEFGFGLSYTTFEFSNLTISTTKPKSPLPSPRPTSIDPPSFDDTLPDPKDALFPAHFRKLKKYIYPYITSASDVKQGKYPYPKGYNTEQPPSQAGGGPGGNPSLYDVHANVSLSLTNTGNRKGKQVVQLYLSFPPGVTDEGDPIDFPVKVLRAFEKVELEPAASGIVTLELTRRDLSFWSVRRQNWVMPTEGKFLIRVGASSRDLPLEAEF